MSDLQAIVRVIPPNPSDINFERDFRTNAEALLEGIQEFDLTFQSAISFMGKSTFEEGIGVIKTESNNSRAKIVEALTAVNLASDTSLVANQSWQFGSDVIDTASNLRFASLQDRFAYVDSNLEQAKGTNATIHDRFVATETIANASAAEIADAHDPALATDTLRLRFERGEAFEDDILINSLSNANVVGKFIDEAFFISLASETTGGNQVYRFVMRIENHGFSNDELIYLRKNPLNVSHPSYSTDGYADQKYYVEIINSSSNYVFLRKYKSDDTNIPSGTSPYLLASDVGVSGVDLSQEAGGDSFDAVFTGSLSTFVWQVNQYTTDGVTTQPDYELVNIFNSASERFYTIETRTTSLENRATSIETEINAAHRTGSDTLDSRFDDLDALLSNSRSLSLEKSSQPSTPYPTVEARFLSSEDRITTAEDTLVDAYTNLTETSKTYTSIHQRFESDETRIKDNEDDILEAYSLETEAGKSYTTIQNRFSQDETRIKDNEDDIEEAYTLEVEQGKTYSTIQNRFSQDETRIKDNEDDILEAYTLETEVGKSYTTIQNRFAQDETRIKDNEDDILEAYTLEAESGKSYSTIQDRFSQDETRIADLETEVDAAHRSGADTLDLRFDDLDTLLLNARSLELAKAGGSQFVTVEARFFAVEDRTTDIETELNNAHRSVGDDLHNRFFDVETLVTSVKTEVDDSHRDAGDTLTNRFNDIDTILTNSISLELANAPAADLNAQNEFNSLEERFSSAETRATNLETEVNNAHRDSSDTLDLRFDDIDSLLENAFKQVGGSSTADYSSIEVRFDSGESRISSVEAEIDAAHRSPTDTLNLRFTDLATRYSKDSNGENLDLGFVSIDERLVDSEDRITTLETSNTADKGSYNSVDERISAAEANIVSNDTDIVTINTTLTSRETRYDSDSGSHSTINERFDTKAELQGSSTVSFAVKTLDVHDGLDMNTTRINNVPLPINPNEAASKQYIDSQIASRDAQITDLEDRPEVPAFQTNGTDEGKILQISGDAATWQTPAQVDTSSAYSWIPDVAFQQVQFDGEVLLDRTLDPGFTYYVAGDLRIANGVTLTVAGSDTVAGARLVVQGHILGDASGIVLDRSRTNNPILDVGNWQNKTGYYTVEGTVLTSDLNLEGDFAFDSCLLLMEGCSFQVDTNCNLTWKDYKYGFIVNGSLVTYDNEASIPANLLASKGSILQFAGSVTNTVTYFDQLAELQSTKARSESNFQLVSKFLVTETATERIFEFLGT